MTEDLHLTSSEMGWAFFAFVASYALFEIPGGFLGDWMGARKVLMRIVIWWSIFTALTGAVWSFLSLVVTRACSAWGSGRVSEHDEDVHDLAAARRARASPGHHVAERALGRGLHAAPGRLDIWSLCRGARPSPPSGCWGLVWAVFYTAGTAIIRARTKASTPQNGR